MKTNIMALTLAFAVPVALAAGPGGPAGRAPLRGSDSYAQSGAPLPHWRHEHGVRYMCGGVGAREQGAMQRQRGWDLKLTFATRTGQYLADVDVDILQGKRQVLSARCDGPLMLVDLQRPGRYLVRASAAGREVSRTVVVPSRGHAAAVLRWPLGPDGGRQDTKMEH